MRLFVAGRELVTARSATAGQYSTTGHGTHPLAETVLVGALAFAGLVGTFHGRKVLRVPRSTVADGRQMYGFSGSGQMESKSLVISH